MKAENFTETGVPSVPFEMVFVKGGRFEMESEGSEAYTDENPVRTVKVSDFWLGQVPVTQALWERVMGNNPSFFAGSNRPVEQVSWKDTQRLLEILQSRTSKAYRLPTEAEWEYAARGGSKSRRYKYAGSNKLSEVAWFRENSHKETKPVGLKFPNELGLYDMSGNIGEWVEDHWPRISGGTSLILFTDYYFCGSGWRSFPKDCRLVFRGIGDRGVRDDDIGFRIALSTP